MRALRLQWSCGPSSLVCEGALRYVRKEVFKGSLDSSRDMGHGTWVMRHGRPCQPQAHLPKLEGVGPRIEEFGPFKEVPEILELGCFFLGFRATLH